MSMEGARTYTLSIRQGILLCPPRRAICMHVFYNFQVHGTALAEYGVCIILNKAHFRGRYMSKSTYSWYNSP